MTKFTFILAAAGALGFTGSAMADDHSNAGGTFDCVLVDGGERGTVGNMMKHLRDRENNSGNPNEIVNDFSFSDEWDNVGELIFDKCGEPGNPS